MVPNNQLGEKSTYGAERLGDCTINNLTKILFSCVAERLGWTEHCLLISKNVNIQNTAIDLFLYNELNHYTKT